MLQKIRCICFTATPDDNDGKGAEKQVINALRIAKFSYGFPEESIALASIDSEVDCKDTQAIITFIQEEIKTRAVLLYCTEEMKDSILSIKIPFIDADTEQKESTLRELDIVVDSVYKLVVATTTEAMRGIDYRAPQTGITLIVGKSFNNIREADQGLKRVGRYKDYCKRVLIRGVHLIDPSEAARYQTKLLGFCREMNAARSTQVKPLGSFI